MKVKILVLLLALFCACSTREVTPPASEPPVEAPVISESKEPAPTLEPLNEPDVKDVLTIAGSTATITLSSKRSFDSVCLQGLQGSGELTVSIDDNKIYQQENASTERWCWLGTQDTDTLSITFPGDEISEVFKISEPDKGPKKLLSAYLPHSYYTENLLSNGSIAALDEITIHTGCYWLADGSLEVKQTLPSIIEAIQTAYPDLTIYCTINPKKGGAAAIMTAEKRQILIQSMLDFCDEYGIDGVDIDWEFPAEDQWDEFSDLIVELSEALHSTDRSLSLAFYPEDINLSAEAVKAIHKVNVMAYDLFDENGYHSTYESAVRSIDYFCSIGFETSQLSLGIPAYGRPLSGDAVWPYYLDYAEQLADGSNLLNENYFNSPQLAQDKTLLAREENLQGVFLYHLASDAEGELSLISACAEVLK